MQSESQETQQIAARLISAGGVIAFRTDTFYGLGADPLNTQAVARIRKLKGREDAKPILVLISDHEVVDRFISGRSKLFDSVAEKHWPGPLTLIGVARPELPQVLTAASGTIGVRLPADERVQKLVRVCGGALTATSANLSGSLAARTAEEVKTYFEDGVDLIMDDGEVTVSAPSTVLDLSGTYPRMIREGVIKREQLGAFLSESTSSQSSCV